MLGARLLAYVTGTVNQELLLRNEYLATENLCLAKTRSTCEINKMQTGSVTCVAWVLREP